MHLLSIKVFKKINWLLLTIQQKEMGSVDMQSDESLYYQHTNAYAYERPHGPYA